MTPLTTAGLVMTSRFMAAIDASGDQREPLCFETCIWSNSMEQQKLMEYRMVPWSSF